MNKKINYCCIETPKISYFLNSFQLIITVINFSKIRFPRMGTWYTQRFLPKTTGGRIFREILQGFRNLWKLMPWKIDEHFITIVY